MSDSIVVEPQSQAQVTSPAPAPKPAAAPTDPLSTLVVPQDLTDIDPTYRGKSVRDIITMHQHSTKKIGELGNEIGVWKGLVSDISGRANQPATAQGAPKNSEPVEISNEQLLANPTEAITKVLTGVLTDKLKPLEDALGRQSLQNDFAALRQEYPSMIETGNDPQFQEWVAGAKSRQADAAAAQRGDSNAARRLLENWNDRQSLVASLKTATTTTATEPASGAAAARMAVTETGGHGAAAPAKQYNAQDIVNMIINEPEKYRSEAVQKDIRAAAQAGLIQM